MLIDAEKVDDARLRVLLQVIDHHQDRVSTPLRTTES